MRFRADFHAFSFGIVEDSSRFRASQARHAVGGAVRPHFGTEEAELSGTCDLLEVTVRVVAHGFGI